MDSAEHRLQVSCVRWFRMQYPHLTPLLFAIPNGGVRSPKVGAYLKDEGVVAGVADLCFLAPNGNAVFIELKTPQGRQSDSQKKWQQQITQVGYRYEVVRDVDGFINIIKPLCLQSQRPK